MKPGISLVGGGRVLEKFAYSVVVIKRTEVYNLFASKWLSFLDVLFFVPLVFGSWFILCSIISSLSIPYQNNCSRLKVI